MVTFNFGRTWPTLLPGDSDFLRLVAVFCFASLPPFCTHHEKNIKQAGRRRISTPSPNFIAMATRFGPQHFAWFHCIGHPRKPPGRPKHLRSICHTSQLIGDFVLIWGSKFWALGSLSQKSKNNVLWSVTWRNDSQKWLDSIEKRKKKKQFEGAWQTNRQSQLLTINDSWDRCRDQ